MAQKKKTKKRRLTLRELLKNDEPIWVRNMTGDPETGRDPGVVSLQIGSGDNLGWLRVPAGNDPVCLSDQADASSLKSCRDLFLAIHRSGLELLDPEDAEEYYKQNEERREIMEEKINDYYKTQLPPQTKKSKNVPRQNVNPKVGDVCLKAKGNVIPEREALERLLEQDKILGEEDYRYVLANGVYDSLKKWAMDKLKELQDEQFGEHLNDAGKGEDAEDLVEASS